MVWKGRRGIIKAGRKEVVKCISFSLRGIAVLILIDKGGNGCWVFFDPVEGALKGGRVWRR